MDTPAIREIIKNYANFTSGAEQKKYLCQLRAARMSNYEIGFKFILAKLFSSNTKPNSF